MTCIPPLLPGVFERLPGGRNLCSKGPRGLKFVMHIVTPSWGADHQNFNKNFDEKKNIFCLISPTHFPAYNSCSTCTRGLKFVMRIDPPHAGPTTSFLFQNSRTFFLFFKKKHVPWRVLLCLITGVLMDLDTWNSLCILTPLMQIRLPHSCYHTRSVAKGCVIGITGILFFFPFFFTVSHVYSHLIGRYMTAYAATERWCPALLLRQTSRAHIFRSNGGMGLKIGMYSNPPMGGRQPNFQKNIGPKKVFVLLPLIRCRLISRVPTVLRG